MPGSFRARTLALAFVFALVALPAQAQQGTGWSQRVDLIEGSGAEKGGDSTFVCDPYQNLHMLWGAEIGDRGYLFYQNDVEGQLSTPVDVIATNDAQVAEPVAVVDPGQNILHVVWGSAYTGGRLYHASVPLALANDPKAWSTPSLLHPRVSTLGGTLAIDSRGTLHVIYGVSDGDALQPRLEYIQSTDGGKRWSTPITILEANVPVASEIYGKLALDGAGRMHLGVTIRSFAYGVRSEVGYMRSTDGGQNWSKYERIGEVSEGPQGLARMAAYAFGSDDIHLTWHDQSRRLHLHSTDGGQTWGGPVEFANLGAAFGGSNQMVEDGAGVLHAITGTNGGFYTTAFKNGGWQPLETIDGATPFDPHDWQIAVCGGNQMHAAYNRAGEDRNIMYFTRQLPVPAVERRAIPTPSVTATPEETAAPEVAEQRSEPEGGAGVQPSAAPPPSALQSTTSILVLATLPVLMLLAGVFILKRR